MCPHPLMRNQEWIETAIDNKTRQNTISIHTYINNEYIGTYTHAAAVGMPSSYFPHTHSKCKPCTTLYIHKWEVGGGGVQSGTLS